MPPTADNDFAMPINYLHIWPRGSFLLIALPNQDKSFTCTLFMPGEIFASIKNEDDLMKFFEENFKDTIPLFGK
jgi:kynurenine 3-monooxygenase